MPLGTIAPAVFEFFGHTADLGLRVTARDLESLLAEAAHGLLAMLIDNPEQVQVTSTVEVKISGQDPAYLLFDFLRELLVIFDTRHLLLADFEVEVSGNGLHARARGEQLDPARHRLAHEVKAITYHGLKVVKTDDGWLAELIVDI